MSNIYNEETFESNIVDSLVSDSGYTQSNAAHFDPQLALDTTRMLSFLSDTQPEKWQLLLDIHQDQLEDKMIARLVRELDKKGMLKVIREGIDDHGIHLDLAYFKPESDLNTETIDLYQRNILSVTRQVHFSVKNPDLSVDLVLFLNGLPVATVELKNPFTGQDISNAEKQFIYTRDTNEMLFQFKKRALVHFAVDPNEVSMTTHLKGEDTFFLPFNKGYQNGAGNPPNEHGYKTDYLWKKVWNKDSWMDILQKFIHIEEREIRVNGKIKTKETMIFPRYHQLDVVRKLTYDTKALGAGSNYLIQHSAGSGKSNSIAWLAYRLSSLHNAQNEPVFKSVVVVTDRIVLDKQLQDTIYQFDHKQGVVERIDKDSNQLATALKNGVKIIITTVQKFPFILDQIGELQTSKYAVIIDEAHSSQGGETAKKMKQVLTANTLEDAEAEDATDEETVEDNIRQSMMARGKQNNLSFYAFTATPKPKTLEVFGVPNAEGKPMPFHLYSMRQAIEEGFILDVLKGYTTYKTYFRITKKIEDDPELDKKKTNQAIARFLSLHPHNLAQKTEVIVEHFRNITMKKIGGKAKAMVVTSSRLHAYRYYQEFQRYLKEKAYTDIRVLVAFSGALKDPDTYEKVTEPLLNGFSEKELPKKFATDEYRILLVADKYQTGYDEPLLHTMFVDKKLSGVKAVQTLSRLNRTHTGKEDTFILDFANDPSEILEAFQPYYENTSIEDTTDPNHLYDLKNSLIDSQVFWKSEVESFSKVFFSGYQTKADQQKLYAILTPTIDRYKSLEKGKQEDFKKQLTAFIRAYAFLAQVMPFSDPDLEKIYVFARLLRNALPKNPNERFELNDKVALQYYKLQKMHEGSITLEKLGTVELMTMKDAGSVVYGEEEKSNLSEIIKMLNERLGTEFTEADQLFIDQIEQDIYNNEELMNQAKVNPKDSFKYPLNEELINVLIERMDRNEELVMKFINDPKLRNKLEEYLMPRIYKKLEQEDIGQLIKKGESQKLEFKSSLRWDVRQGITNKDLEKVILKTISGYMNSDGGQLIIGVEDDGSIFGLENDYRALNNGNRDKFENHLVQLVKTSMGADCVRYFSTLFGSINNKDVCLITVMKASKPIYLRSKNSEEFFVRTGNNTSALTLSETQSYIESQWK